MFWRHTPFFRLLLPFIAGILVAIYSGINSMFPVFGLSACIIAILLYLLLGQVNFKFKYRHFLGIIVNIGLFFAGISLVIFNTAANFENHFRYQEEHSAGYVVEVIEPVVEKENSVKVVASVTEAIQKDGEDSKRVSGQIMVYLEKDSLSLDLRYGDILFFTAKPQPVDPPSNPGEFDYKQYLSFHNIYDQVYLPGDKWKKLSSGEGNPVLSLAFSIRKRLYQSLSRSALQGDELAVASALILGLRENLSPEITKAYSSSGAMHVLAVSGLHVGIIYLVLNMLLRFMLKIRNGHILRAILLLLFLWLYAFVTGLSPSVLRATTMFSFIITGTAISRHTNIYNTLAASAFLLLLVNPYMIMEVGFQLSFLAVLGIVYMQPKIYGQIYISNPLLDKLWAITAVSIAAQVVTFPLGLLYFHQFPVYFFLSNLVVIPAAMLILGFGFAVLALGWIPWIGWLISVALYYIIHFLNMAVSWIEDLPYSLIQGVSISIAESWIIYFTIALFLWAFAIRKVSVLYAALSMTVVFLGIQLIQDMSQLHQRKMIVYKVNKLPAFDFVSGLDHIFMSEEKLLNDRDRMLFHIMHNWDDLGLYEKQFLDINKKQDYTDENFLRYKDFIWFEGKKMLLLKEGFRIPSEVADKMSLDYIIVTGNADPDLSKLIKVFEFDQLVIDSSNSYWKTERIRGEARALGIEVYDVLKEGAFVLQF